MAWDWPGFPTTKWSEPPDHPASEISVKEWKDAILRADRIIQGIFTSGEYYSGNEMTAHNEFVRRAKLCA